MLQVHFDVKICNVIRRNVKTSLRNLEVKFDSLIQRTQTNVQTNSGRNYKAKSNNITMQNISNRTKPETSKFEHTSQAALMLKIQHFSNVLLRVNCVYIRVPNGNNLCSFAFHLLNERRTSSLRFRQV